MENELYHHGVKGMHWGIRRYQNPNGSLTDLGKKRLARDAREKEFNNYDPSTETYYKTSKKNGRTDLYADPNRYVKEDDERIKKLADSGSSLVRSLSEANAKSIKNNKKEKMDLSEMTDKEMREKINRAILERQYNDMFAPQKSTAGREHVAKILETAGSALAITKRIKGVIICTILNLNTMA